MSGILFKVLLIYLFNRTPLRFFYVLCNPLIGLLIYQNKSILCIPILHHSAHWKTPIPPKSFLSRRYDLWHCSSKKKQRHERWSFFPKRDDFQKLVGKNLYERRVAGVRFNAGLELRGPVTQQRWLVLSQITKTGTNWASNYNEQNSHILYCITRQASPGPLNLQNKFLLPHNQ